MRRTILLTLVAVMTLAACDRAAETDLTTTTTASITSGPVAEEPAPETTVAAPETTVAGSPETTAAGTPVGDYTIEVAASEDAGEILWVSIAPEDYTDRDLEDFVARVRDERENLVGFYVVDDPAAVDAVRVAEEARTEEEQALVDAHYLVSLTEGNVVTFRGPFESAGSFVLGS